MPSAMDLPVFFSTLSRHVVRVDATPNKLYLTDHGGTKIYVSEANAKRALPTAKRDVAVRDALCCVQNEYD